MKPLLFFGVAIGAYFAGFAAYAFTLSLIWGERPGGDTVAVLYWGAFAYLVILVPASALLFQVLSVALGRLRDSQRWLPFAILPLAGSALSILPLGFVIAGLGGGPRSLLTSESALFAVFFATSGAILGLGWSTLFRVQRQRAQ